MVDWFLIATVAGVLITGITVTFTVRNDVKRGRQEQREQLQRQIDGVANKVTGHIDKKLDKIDSQFEKVNYRIDVDEEDIGDIELQMKQLVKDAKETCDKLSKFDYIEKQVIPDFKKVIIDFYKFKAKVDSNLLSNNKDGST